MVKFKEKIWHQVFEFGIFIKAINGVIEIITGVSFLLISKTTLNNFFLYFSGAELLEDPNDWLIRFLVNSLQHLSNDAKVFASIYILFHGLLNLLLVIGLYREKFWVYLVTIYATLIFLSYQIYRFIHTHGLGLLIIIIFDLAFILVLWHEYRYHLKKV